MSMKCAQCGTRLVPGSLSCANCGQQFATPVPPDPAPVQAAAAPPPQAPYGQAPQAPYGQAPQAPYGQAPQGQYGQAPVGGPTPGPAGPQDPVKKYGPWVAAVVVAGFAYNHFSKPATPPAPQPNAPVAQPTQPQQPVVQPVTQPTQPQQPTDPTQPQQPQPPVVQPVTQPTQGGGDSQQTIADNIKRVIAAKNQFAQLVQSAKENDPNEAAWLAAMQQNTQELKAAADQGGQLQWPAEYAQAQGYYREACGDFSFVGDHWTTALQTNDKAGAEDCISRFKAGDNALSETKAAVDAVGGGASQNAMKSGTQSSLSAGFQSETKNSAPLTYHLKK